MGILAWIQSEYTPTACDSTAFIYDHMESQSGCGLPVVYQTFDASRKGHWTDRGAILDFLWVVAGQGKRLLDFGPGDGWPSLGLAAHAAEVVGVDGSARRVQVCADNAARLSLPNARFLHVPAGERLPFPDGAFDGAAAAASVEQAPDPRATLQELHRVLRPGGRLRLSYEALGRYRGGRERDLWLQPTGKESCVLILYDRRINEEYVVQYGLRFRLSASELKRRLGATGRALSLDDVTLDLLRELHPESTGARTCTTRHPSGKTYARWLHEIGFASVRGTHNGRDAAGLVFERLPEGSRPATREGVEALLSPVVATVVDMAAPLESDPWITAVK